MSFSFKNACVISVGGTTTLLPGFSPASIIASDLTDTSPTTAGFVATVAAHAEFGSLIAEISAVETSAEYMSI